MQSKCADEYFRNGALAYPTKEGACEPHRSGQRELAEQINTYLTRCAIFHTRTNTTRHLPTRYSYFIIGVTMMLVGEETSFTR
jgi:hypothetical protein